MNFKQYSGEQIDAHLKILVKDERQLLHDILLTVKEIDQRRIYEQMGYASLFLYLTEEIGYTNGSAIRRIDGARLLMDVPEVAEKIKSGEVTLNQTTLVQDAARRVYENTGRKVSPAEKAEIMAQINDTEIRESQQQVAAFFELPVIKKTKIQVQADGSWLVTMQIPKELVQEIEYAQSLVSHAVPSKELVDYLEYCTRHLIKQKTSVRTKENAKDTSQESEIQEKTVPRGSADAEPTKDAEVAGKTGAPAEFEPAGEKFSQGQRKILMQNQKSCQHVDPKTQKPCPNTWFLQADHKQSRWAGGQAKLQNGQMLCAAHNQKKYRKEAGIEYQ